MNINSYTFQNHHFEKILSQYDFYMKEPINPSVIPDASINCAICLDNIFGSHSITVLHVSKKLPSKIDKNAPGMHFFHNHCLNECWKEGPVDKDRCPTCRSYAEPKIYFSSVTNAVASNCQLDLVCKLIDNGADCDAPHATKKIAAIHIAVKNGNEALLRTLLSKGADVNVKDDDMNTALHYAVKEENLRILKILLAYSPDINSQGLGGCTALYIAAGKPKCPELFLTIIDYGANFEIENCKGRRVIHYAVESGHQAALEALIAKGADVNAVDHNNCTALHYVNAFHFNYRYKKKKNKSELAKTLIAAGARVDIIAGPRCCNVFDGVSWKDDDRELLKVLLPPAVEIFEDIKNVFVYDNILYYAFLAKDKEIVRQLVAKGAKIDDVHIPEIHLDCCLGNEKQEFLDLLKNV